MVILFYAQLGVLIEKDGDVILDLDSILSKIQPDTIQIGQALTPFSNTIASLCHHYHAFQAKA
jgi:hypothetical protein